MHIAMHAGRHFGGENKKCGALHYPINPRVGAFLVSRWTWNAVVMADLSSDKVTRILRTGPRGRTNDGSACRPLFMHSPRPEPWPRAKRHGQLIGGQVHQYGCAQRQLYGLATR